MISSFYKVIETHSFEEIELIRQEMRNMVRSRLKGLTKQMLNRSKLMCTSNTSWILLVRKQVP